MKERLARRATEARVKHKQSNFESVFHPCLIVPDRFFCPTFDGTRPPLFRLS